MSVPLVKITLTEDQGRQLDHLPATQTLSVTSAHRIEWVRGGSSPEATQVTFEASTNGGTSYLPLGGGTRITGGWELTGINLPASGLLRARARTGSGSLLETVTPFSGLLAPEIAVTGNGVNITSGDPAPTLADHRDFGTRIVGAGTVVRSFTLHNSGTADLTLGTITLGGAADFTVTTAPTSPIPAGGTTTMQVTFAASAAGIRSAVLSVATNDFDENPFIFSIQGTGLASAGDDDGDSITNLLEFAFGTDPAGGASGPAPTQVVNGTITRHGTPATFAATGGGMQALFGRRNDWSSAGLSYAVQFSADLSVWETSTTTLPVIADDGEIEAVTVPYPTLIGGLEARFFRLSVTLNP